MLKDITGVLDPGGRDFIASVMARPVLFERAAGQTGHGAAGLKGRLWEFTLTYLLVERGSRFNQRDYMGSLVRQMAAHHNLRYGDLLHAITSVLASSEASHPLRNGLLTLLGELAEKSGGSTPTLETAGARSANVLDACALYEELRQHLLPEAMSQRDEAGFEDRLTQLIRALARAHPEQLLRLYRELQAGDLPWSRVAATLSARALEQLITAFLTLQYQGGAEGRADLLRAIADHARRIGDVKRYFSQLLECLAQGQVIDFDAMVTQSPAAKSLLPAKPVLEPARAESERPSEDATLASLVRYLESGRPLSVAATARLIRAIEYGLAYQPERLRLLLWSALAGRETTAALIDLLPERLLSRFLLLLQPDAHHWMHVYADIIATACYTPAIPSAPGRLRQLKWQYLFQYLFEAGGSFEPAVFVRRLVSFLAEQINWPDANAFRELLGQQLALTRLPSTREAHQAIVQALDQSAEPEDQTGEPLKLLYNQTQAAPDPTEDIYITNAGQVLAAPYLPRLFTMLGLTEHSDFKDQRAAERAVHLLQFMVNEQTDAPEYQLVLNKLLCGVTTGQPIDRAIDIENQERESIEGLIQGMIQNWKIIGNTSVTGFRESFLQREGRLQLRDDAWHLLVEPRAFDMLLDQVPWSFRVIKHPWMERAIHVDWR